MTVYPGAAGAFEMFEDDGKSFEYKRGGWMGLALTWTNRDRRLAIGLVPGSRLRAPLVGDVVIRVAGEQATRSVKFSGRPPFPSRCSPRPARYRRVQLSCMRWTRVARP